MSTDTCLCARCRRVLVDQDDVGWYYQVSVTDLEMPNLVFMDRVHECDGKPHLVIAPERDSSPRCDACDEPESYSFHDADKIGKFSGYHPFGGFKPLADPVREAEGRG